MFTTRGVSVRGATVGLYCAVVHQPELLVSVPAIAARDPQSAFNQGAVRPRTWLGALNLGLVESWQREPENGAAR